MTGMTVTQLHNLFAVLALVAIGGAVLMLLARIIPSVASVRFLGALHSSCRWRRSWPPRRHWAACT
jgi:hypothetical protein